jgi:hypothetical protein
MAILLVLAIGNGWSPRIATSCPVERSIAATPMRPFAPFGDLRDLRVQRIAVVGREVARRTNLRAERVVERGFEVRLRLYRRDVGDRQRNAGNDPSKCPELHASKRTLMNVVEILTTRAA